MLTIGLAAGATVQAQTISAVAGNDRAGYSGDGGPATYASLYNPQGVALDAAGNIYIADTSNNRIRKVMIPTGIITTVAGNGVTSSSGDGGSATSASVLYPTDVTVDVAGNIYIVTDYRIRKVTVATGIITTVAGNGMAGYSGDGGPATRAMLHCSTGVTVNAAGDLYYADTCNNRVRKVTAATGIITTVVGNGTAGYSGDGGPATDAMLNNPRGLAIDAVGNLYIADHSNNRVRKVTAATGIITTVAGSSTFGYYGDGGAATQAALFQPSGVTVTAAGDLYIADRGNNRIRKVNSSGIISTEAGNGHQGYEDGAAATSVVDTPSDVASDAAGSVYIAAEDYSRIRKVLTNVRADVVWRHYVTGANNIWLSANAATTKTVTSEPDLAWKIVGVADFDSSGYTDLLWRNSSTGANEIWPSAGSATAISLPSFDPAWMVAATGDFCQTNGDGYSDILWRNSNTGQNAIWAMGTGGQLLWSDAITTMDLSWKVVGSGDFNKDGFSDILWRKTDTGENVIWLSGNSETRQTMTTQSTAWIVAGIGDFNGDGVSDVLWRNTSTGSNVIWQSANSTKPQAVTKINSQYWKVAGVGDVNNDDKGDIIWRNSLTGTNTVWLSADSTKTQSMATVSDQQWKIVGVGIF